MKVVHNSKRKTKLTKEPGEDWRDLGKQFEADGSFDDAIEAYENDLRANRLHENSWHRLMVLYRKQKLYDKEWKLLGEAIETYEKFYQPGNKKAHGKKVLSISKALMKSTGLTDTKGRSTYQPEPLGKWYKRKATLQKKLGTNKK